MNRRHFLMIEDIKNDIKNDIRWLADVATSIFTHSAWRHPIGSMP